MGLVIRALLRDLLRQPWQLALVILSIATGVSVVVGVDIANESALAEFRRAGQVTSGSATHRIVGGTRGLAESVYRHVRVDAGVRLAAPVIEARVTLHGSEDSWTLIGIDALSDYRLRQFRLQSVDSGVANFTAGDSAWPVFGPKERLAGMGGRVVLATAGRQQAFQVVGHIDLAGERSLRLLVTDIAWAQEFLSMQGYISHIDLRLGAAEADSLERHLPAGTRLIDLGIHDGAREDMSRAFRTNLTALSLLALVVAMFLVYSAVSFQVARRRRLFGLLGAMGTSRQQLFGVLVVELLLIGLLGTLLGIALGVLLAQMLTALVSGTIDTLYHAVAQPAVRLSATSLWRALLVGLVATLLSGLAPAIIAGRTSVDALLRGQSGPHGLRVYAPRLLRYSIATILPASLLILWPGKSLAQPFAGLFLMICGLSLLGPWLLYQMGRWRRFPGGVRFGLVPRMALGNAARHIDRTGVAVAALSVAVSATLGVELMIQSFRFSVEDWLSHYLRADIYLSVSGTGGATLSDRFVAELNGLPGIAHLSTGRRVSLETASGPITVFSLDVPQRGFAGFRVIDRLEGDLWSRFHEQGEVLVSEPLARRHGLSSGDLIDLPTDQGMLPFTIAAVYRDYSSDRGLVTMDRKTWDRFFDDPSQVSAALYLAPGEDVPALIERVRRLPAAPTGLFVRSNRGCARSRWRYSTRPSGSPGSCAGSRLSSR